MRVQLTLFKNDQWNSDMDNQGDEQGGCWLLALAFCWCFPPAQRHVHNPSLDPVSRNVRISPFFKGAVYLFIILLGIAQPWCSGFVTGQNPVPSRINKIVWLMIGELGLDAVFLQKIPSEETLQLANKALLAEAKRTGFHSPRIWVSSTGATGRHNASFQSSLTLQ